MTEKVHANLVSVMLQSDGATFECREIDVSHIEIEKRKNAGKPLGNISDAGDPKVVLKLTFSAVLKLATDLQELLPEMHRRRVAESWPWLPQEMRELVINDGVVKTSGEERT